MCSSEWAEDVKDADETYISVLSRLGQRQMLILFSLTKLFDFRRSYSRFRDLRRICEEIIFHCDQYM